MTIKQGFKFLNTPRLSLENKVMFFVRQAFEVFRAVIILNSIQVVNYPVFRQWFAVSFFPDKNVFQYIASSTSSTVVFFQNENVAIFSLNSPTFPSCSFLAFRLPKCFGMKSPSPFHVTTRATLSVVFYSLTTIRAQSNYCQSPISTFFTSCCMRVDRLPAINTRMLMLFSPPFCCCNCYLDSNRIVSRARDATQARIVLNSACDFRPKKKAK